eukprot:scaffold29539_cov72-Skeletonema_dohrnii-CCMP3373.AAC.1
MEVTTLGLLDPCSNQLSYKGSGKLEMREGLSLHATLLACKSLSLQYNNATKDSKVISNLWTKTVWLFEDHPHGLSSRLMTLKYMTRKICCPSGYFTVTRAMFDNEFKFFSCLMLQKLGSKLCVGDDLPPPEAAGNVDANHDVSASPIVESISINPTIKKNADIIEMENISNDDDNMMETDYAKISTNAGAAPARPCIPATLSCKFMEVDKQKLLHKAQVEALCPQKDD